MKFDSCTHDDYVIFVTTELKKECGTPASMMLLQQFYSDLIFWITSVDLSQTASLLRSRYSPKNKGRRPRDPVNMLRQGLARSTTSFVVCGLLRLRIKQVGRSALCASLERKARRM